jgi:hypothetical protein
MPTKRYLTFQHNRLSLRQTLDHTRQHLQHLSRILYHYANKGHPLRQASEDLLRRFDLLDKQITDRIKSGERHL